MAQFAYDTFTDANGTQLTSHVSNSGHSWKVSGVGNTPSATPVIQSNQLSPLAANGETVAFYLDAAPPSADYSFTVDVTYNGAGTELAGPGLRIAATSVQASSFGYFLGVSTSITGFRLRRYDGGSPTNLQNINAGLATGITYRMTIEAAGSTITGRIQRLSDNQWLTSAGTWQAGQINCCTATDSTYAAAGRPGLNTYGLNPFTTQDNASANATVAATAVTLTGPTTGTVGSPSTNFTVGANGDITGTVTVTPSDAGAGGSFTPTSVAISAGTPTATFTYTASSSGAKTISVTNNGSLTNPSNITYTASSAAATAITLSGPTTGTVGVASSNFTVGANGAITGTVVVTPSDGGAGGTFTPSTVSISSGSPTGTFTYTAASTGAKTIAVTNNGGLTNPGSITYTASTAPATAVTMSGPSGGVVSVASTNFTVGANGAITGSVVVTPSDGGGGGTFTPSTVTISSGSPTGTFTYTPASTGAKTISATNNGGLANPGNLTYTVTAVAGTFTNGSAGALANNGNSPQASLTLEWVKLINPATGLDVTLKTNVAVNNLRIFSISDPALVAGTTLVAFFKRAGAAEYGWGLAVVS